MWWSQRSATIKTVLWFYISMILWMLFFSVGAEDLMGAGRRSSKAARFNPRFASWVGHTSKGTLLTFPLSPCSNRSLSICNKIRSAFQQHKHIVLLDLRVNQVRSPYTFRVFSSRCWAGGKPPEHWEKLSKSPLECLFLFLAERTSGQRKISSFGMKHDLGMQQAPLFPA